LNTANYNAATLDDPLRPTRVEVSLGALSANLAAIRARVGGARVMAVIKANAYGHGLIPVARHLTDCGADSLGVAFLEEGIALRQAGITLPILVFGGIGEKQVPLFIQNDLTLTAPSIEKLRLIDEAAAALGTTARVHLKVDTGMERIGMHWYSAEKLLEASLTCRHMTVEGIYSHFANADAAPDDLAHARLQLERFLEVLSFYAKRSLPSPTRHIANSGAILQLPESHLDLVRPGILLYGVYPSAECAQTVPVTPALTLKSRVVFFKVVKAGHPISYGSTWTPERDTRIVTVPVGYGDGYFRALSNQAHVLIRGRRCAIAGRVCMDQTMVNVGPDGTAYNGDEVILLGTQDGETITAAELAAHARTIPYEILTNLNTRIPRVYR
jgi:alanine racemase